MTTPTFQDVLTQINLRSPHAAMFDTHAKVVAEQLKGHGKSNKTTQIRRFYDELLRWKFQLGRATPEEFARALPFIRMINARAAYAAQRKGEGGTLVTQDFTEFLRRLTDQIEDTKTLDHACTMFEAVIGYSPRSSDP